MQIRLRFAFIFLLSLRGGSNASDVAIRIPLLYFDIGDVTEREALGTPL